MNPPAKNHTCAVLVCLCTMQLSGNPTKGQGCGKDAHAANVPSRMAYVLVPIIAPLHTP